ncbi:MAG: UDP-4-amino-4,6-dideoxy-N-acetyl-beta-L-altrosamine transaminase [Candidatus Magasanikbacteria bacterium]|nr:UDP-4-amino-4,6-dideoxy-N-acetyl-beta-L-altrosamine transaminase [Candidatus Magasanikbacteria bacterium]
MIPYSRQTIEQDDIDAVLETLTSDYLTQGPKVEAFEQALANYCGVKYAVAVANGTAALHTAYNAINLSPGDEIITTPMTFVATSNAAVWQGARPVFVDIKKDSGNIDETLVESAITKKTKAIVSVDYAGRPVEYDVIRNIAYRHNLNFISDAAHSFGASYKGKKIGSLADLTTCSFHPVKGITTGEGGAVLTNNYNFYRKMKHFSSHGIDKKVEDGTIHGSWYYQMNTLGLNYRLSDIHAALGLSQLKKIDSFIEKRATLASRYEELLGDVSEIILPPNDTDLSLSAWHLYVIRLRKGGSKKRLKLFEALRAKGIWVQVHYIPVHYHPYYKKKGYVSGLCPVAESWYDSIISIPLYPFLSDEDQDVVVETLKFLVQM